MFGEHALLGFTAAALASVAGAQVAYVDVNGVPPGSGTPSDPFTSIQYALDNSTAPTLHVAPGTYVEDLEFGGRTIIATGGPEVTTIRSDGTGPMAVHITFGATLEGFTITGVTDDRPAVYMDLFAQAFLKRCVIAGNSGVGITGEYDAFLDQCTVYGNGFGNGSPGVVAACCFNFWWLDNSIVWGNAAPSMFYSGPDGRVRYSIVDGPQGQVVQWTNNLLLDPLVWSAQDLHLEPGSPAIDAGNPLWPLDPDGSVADIGAFAHDSTYAPEQPGTYCTSRINSQGCSPTVTHAGTPSIGGGNFTIDCGQVLNNKSGLCFYGFAGKASAYQGGYLCVQAPVRRTALQGSGGNPPPDDCSGVYTFDFGALAASGADPALVPGQSVFAQFWYRDPLQTGVFTTGRSEAIAFELTP